MKHRPGVAAVSVLKPRLVSVAVAACFAAPAAFALPTGPQVVVGSAVFSQQTGALTITNTPGTIINWQGFSIGASEAARFVQQSAQSSVLNRVLGPEASAILGVLQSNGRVWLVNPNGILFGPSARIDVQGLVASTLSISNGNFAAGKMNFEAGANAAAGGIQNQGAITTPKGGNVYLVAPDIQNSGIIRSPQGEVMLAAGRSVSLVDAGHPDVQMVVSAPADQAVNLGQILVDGGRASLFGAMLAQRGVVSASSVGTDAAGNVVFRAAKDVTLAAGSKTMADGGSGGTITVQAREGTNLVYGEVSAKGSDGKGGTIQLLGERVGLMGNASVDASGQLGGGTVLVGGDYQGKNPAVQNASATYVSPDATITANANHNGDGGKVIVWGNDVARMYGTISARGGAEGGDGGFVETSGHALDVAGATVNASAPKGNPGQWLLDPAELTVIAYGGASQGVVYGGGTPADPFIFDSPSPTEIRDADVSKTLDNGTNVKIQTIGEFGGDITVYGGIVNTSGGGRELSLLAHGSIVLETGSSIRGNAGNPLAVTLNARMIGDRSGNVELLSGSSIVSYGGSIVLSGGVNPLTDFAVGVSSTHNVGVLLDGATVDAGGGSITVRGQGYSSAPSEELTQLSGVAIRGGMITTSGNGTMSIVGYGGSSPGAAWSSASQSHGVVIDGGEVTTSGTGLISVLGYGGTGWNGWSASSENHGVAVYGGWGISGGGTVDVTGYGGGYGGFNYGVLVEDATITATNASNGRITVFGQGGGNGYYNYGVHVSGPAASIQGGSQITVIGYGGGSGGSDNNHGVYVQDGTIGSDTGNAIVTVFGQGGGGGGSYNHGVFVEGGTAAIQSGNWVTVTGYGGAGSGSETNYGVYVQDGTITSGTDTTVYGKAGDGAENGYGVYVYSSDYDAKIYGASSVSVTGYGGSGGNDGNKGVYVQYGSIVSPGDVTVIGYGGDGGCCSGGNHGVNVYNGKIRSESGVVTVTGQGGDSGDDNHGVYVSGTDAEIYGGSQVIVTGYGGGYGWHSGVLVADGGKITSAAGTVTVTGHGADGGESTNGVGVLVTGANAEISGGSFVTVTGYGSNSGYGSDNRGVVVADGGKIRSVGDMVMVTGYGGTDNDYGNNIGVQVSGNGSIDGGGGVTITGIRGESLSDDSSNIGVVIDTGGTVGSAGTNTVSIVADTMSFYGGFISANMTTGEVRLQPYTNDRDVYLTGVKDPAVLSLYGGDVDAITAGKLVIGPASGNTVGNIIVSYGGPVFTVPTLELNAYGDVTIDGALLQNSGAVNISGNNLIVQSATYGGVLIGSSITANMAGDISVGANANAGAAIKSSSPSGTVNLTTTGGGISLWSSGSNLAEIGTDAVSGTVSLTASPEYSIELGDGKVRAPTSLTLTTSVGGNVTQDAAGMVITPTLNLNTDGAVNLVGTANVIGTVQGAAYGGLTLYTVGPLAIGSPGLDAPGQTVGLGSSGLWPAPPPTTGITQSGPITAATLNVNAGYGGVNLTNTTNNIAAFSSDGGEIYGNIILKDSAPLLTLSGINSSHGGTVNVANYGGSITNSAGIWLTGLPSTVLLSGTGITNTGSISAPGDITLNAGTGSITNSGSISRSGTPGGVVLLAGIGIANTGSIAGPSMTLDAGTGYLNHYGGSISTNAPAGVIGLTADTMNIAAPVTANNGGTGSIIVVPKTSSRDVYLGTGSGLALSPTSVGNLVTPNLTIVGPSITVNAPVSSSAATLNLTTTGSFKVQPVTSDAYITAPTMNILAGSVTVYGGVGPTTYGGWISSLGGLLSSAGDVTLIAGGAPGATTGGNAQIYGAPDVQLSIGGKLYLWGQPTTPTARVEANSIATVYLDFTTVESAGIVINGVDGAVTYGGSTGIFVDGAPAMPGAGLMLTYSNAGAAAAAAAAAAAQAAADAAAAKAAADAAAAKAAADKAAADAAAAQAAADAAAAQAAADAAAAKAAADAQAAAEAAAAKAAAEAAAAKAAADKAAADAAAAKAAGDAAAAQAAADAAAKAAAAQAAAEAAAKAAAEAAAKAAADAAAKQAAADAAARAERDALAALEAATLKATTAKTEQKEKDEDAKKKLQLATKTTTTGPASDGTPKNYCNP